MQAWAAKTGLGGGETISFEQCWELAQRWYPGRDELGWVPRTAAETQAIFRELALTSPFWDLGTA